MEDHLPITFQEHAQLPMLGIDPANIGFNTLTMESDRFVCVREREGSRNQVVIVNIGDLEDVVRRPITADSAIMHSQEKIIALRSAKQLQIFNLDTKSKLDSVSIQDEVMFWTWISDTAVGIVTDKAVLHWTINSKPEKVFDRHQGLAGSQIINYQTDRNESWMMIAGIFAKDGRVAGSIQLYSRDRITSQLIEGHAGTFAEMDYQDTRVKLFVFASKTASGSRLHVIEIDAKGGQPRFKKVATDIFFPPEAANDFPVAVHASSKHGCIYLLTKYGFVHLYEVESGACIYMNRISSETIFVSTKYRPTDGIIGVNRKGQVLSVSIDEETVVPHIVNMLNNNNLAIRMAVRNNWKGADGLVKNQFKELVDQGRGTEAARLAANSPQGLLRNHEIMETLKMLAADEEGLTPILAYFGILLEKGRLNRIEALELVRPVLAQGKRSLLEKWLREDKLECSEELGDLVLPLDISLALSIYLRAHVHVKAIQCFAEMGQYAKIAAYAEKVGFRPDFTDIFRQCVDRGAENSVEFAKTLVDHHPPLIDIGAVGEIYIERGAVPKATSFFLDVLKDDSADQGKLQTRCLEINMKVAPQVAEAILGSGLFSHYNKDYIARLCEDNGMAQKALENYTEFRDIKRILSKPRLLDVESTVNYFSRLTPSQSLECLEELLKSHDNLQLVIQISIQYNEILGNERLIRLYEESKNYDELYSYLGEIVEQNKEPVVHFKYIEAGCRTGHVKAVEKMCRESRYYDPVKVKDFLKKIKLSSPIPLMIVCDRFGFVQELVGYLYNHQSMKDIELYIQQVNSRATSQVVETLIDLDCDEDTIQRLLGSVKSRDVDMEELIRVMEDKNRMKLLLPLLESRLEGANMEMYNAIGKIYIDSNSEAEKFLSENSRYDPLVLGRYSEKRNPEFALIIYEKGQCDDEMLRVTNENGLFKQQTRYLVRRKSLELWNRVLSKDNVHRKMVLDSAVGTSLLETKDAEALSVGVKSLMENNLNEELVELLEKILFEDEHEEFKNNTNLQNLLLISVMKMNDMGKLYDYIQNLDDFNHQEMSRLALSKGNFLGAFYIYEKTLQHEAALELLLKEKIGVYDSRRSYEKALDYVDVHGKETPKLYFMLGIKQLESGKYSKGFENIASSYNVDDYHQVIELVEKIELNEELCELYLKYLLMIRGLLKNREGVVENEIIYMYCRMGQYSKVEEEMKLDKDLINWGTIGNRCFRDNDMDGSKLLFSFTGNYGKLAMVNLRCQEYSLAVEHAKRANNIRVWKQVNKECLFHGEYRLAQICGLHLLGTCGDLEELVELYEDIGQFEELLALLETGLGSEKAYSGIYTELALLYSKYKEEKLMEHLKLYCNRINKSRLVRSLEEFHQWRENVFVHVQHGEYDACIHLMIKHSVVAWNHETAKHCTALASSNELVFKVVQFYLDEHPLLLDDLLIAISAKIDHSKTVDFLGAKGHLPLVRGYLKANQSQLQVHVAYIELQIDEEDWKGVERSIEQGHIVQELTSIADRLADHSFVGFRKIAGQIYKKNKKWEKSYQVYIRDGFHMEAIRTCVDSRDENMINLLLERFVEKDDVENFFVILYSCREFIRIERVVENIWKLQILSKDSRKINLELLVPFLCQAMSECRTRLSCLENENRIRKMRQGDSSRGPPF